MLLAHAVLLAEARSYLAALADTARSFEAAMEYERALLHLDWLHEDAVRPITAVPTTDPAVLFRIATLAITNMRAHDVDALQVAICLSMLETARELDAPS